MKVGMLPRACRAATVLALAGLALAQARTGTGTLPLPAANITATSITLSWTTSQRLNTQVWYAPAGGATSHFANWKLVNAHTATLTALAAGASYSVQVESSNYANPDLYSPLFTVTLAGGAPPAPALLLTPASADLNPGDTLTLVPSYSNGQTVGPLTWSVSNGGQISPAGVFTAARAGTFVVTASDVAGLTAQAALTVQAAGSGLPPPSVSGISLTSFTLSWTTTQPLNTQVHFQPPGGPAQTFANWKLISAHLATITGLAPGTTYTVTAESSYFTNPDLFSPAFTVTTTAAAPPAPVLSLSPVSARLTVGGTQAFTASYSNGQDLGPLTWSVSNGSTISPGGLFTATAAGSFTVTATDTATGLSATALVSVTAPAPPAQPPTLTLSPPDAILFTGATLPLTAAYSDGTPATVSWSATNGGAVDPLSGVFTATSPGAFTLTATDGSGVSGMATLTVIAPLSPPPAVACPGCFFTSPAAAWLYAGPNPAWGRGRDLGTLAAAWMAPALNTNSTGFGMPVQHTDGSFGATAMNDYNYGPGWRHDSAVVPNPAGNQWTVSCGWLPPAQFGATSCYGAYDGKDFVINDSTGDYFDIDQMFVDGQGHPVNFGKNGYGSGACGGAGQPVCGIRGVFSGSLATSDPAAGGSTAIGIVSGAGVIVPGELDCATCLNHMVQISAANPLVNLTTCNAVAAHKSGDGIGTLPHAVLCEGGVLWYTGDWTQLDPATHSTAVIALARALALFGGVITDQGGPNLDTFSFYTGYDSPPPLTGIADLLRRLAVFYGTARLQ